MSQQALQQYHALLLKWQKAINLISPNTVNEAWDRHFEDSLQLLPHVPQGATLADIGTGAGFPGMVLAIARPDLDVHLIESDDKKCQFLRTVSRETSSPVKIHTTRIEGSHDLVVPDFVTARALKDLSQLCDFCLPWAQRNPSLKMIFLKGERAQEEIVQARTKYDFAVDTYPSKTDPKAQILVVSAVSVRAS